MARPVLLAFALTLACAPHGPPPQDEVLLRRPLRLVPIDADCGGVLARFADAAAAAGLGRDEQWFHSDSSRRRSPAAASASTSAPTSASRESPRRRC